jgi:hypothetical protein
VGLGDGLTVEVGEGLAVVLGDGLALGLAELLGEAEAVAEGVAPGENAAGGGEDVVQAETDADASKAKTAQPAAVILALSPVPRMVMRIFMGPLCCPRRTMASPRKRRRP